jgi:hypothetical protein
MYFGRDRDSPQKANQTLIFLRLHICGAKADRAMARSLRKPGALGDFRQRGLRKPQLVDAFDGGFDQLLLAKLALLFTVAAGEILFGNGSRQGLNPVLRCRKLYILLSGWSIKNSILLKCIAKIEILFIIPGLFLASVDWRRV